MKAVPIQKGPIKLNEPTMKNSSPANKASSDSHNDSMRKNMKTMDLMSPKSKKR